MEDVKSRLVHLHHCRGIGWKSIFRLLKHDPTLKTMYNLTEYDLKQLLHLPPLTSKQTLLDLHSDRLLNKIHHYYTENIEIVAIFDKCYPPLLKEIFQPPWILYVKGDMKLLTNNLKLAVVGSRQGSSYGRQAINMLFPELIKKEFLIVSGLARGIDSYAHQTAINLGGKTIAVIAGGFYHIYPKENENLALKIMDQHLILSEYPPHTRPVRWQFPMRNRIISGLSRGVLIIEAKKRSGALITADYALEQGREVFSLPGQIMSPFSIGTNQLIQKGAKLVITPLDILEELTIRA
ncbi:DNA-protecting protein DprA [Bacillus aquiflavi]|uniref:DNA-protecting protein DprA n=1 Tax=Bacillus aquiflavi TaxID=2672567 RepID=A0A6B3VTP8_9BACI|nr:DNA-processing protein DprA [Bacillus aquiflavi]MBA4536210.1 DNA-protecting protein DprA [Bacillus aquiflavi]NEY80578.1 DNA-protecting protein DprA [Bacillus aquiflavi]UAC49397.1 DNA-processing protein DprA [Bacillus aquiflavi]